MYRFEEEKCHDCGALFKVDENHPLNEDRTDNERYAQCPDCGRRYTVAHVV